MQRINDRYIGIVLGKKESDLRVVKVQDVILARSSTLEHFPYQVIVPKVRDIVHLQFGIMQEVGPLLLVTDKGSETVGFDRNGQRAAFGSIKIHAMAKFLEADAQVCGQIDRRVHDVGRSGNRQVTTHDCRNLHQKPSKCCDFHYSLNRIFYICPYQPRVIFGYCYNEPMAKTKTNPYRGLVAYQIYPRSFKDSNGDGVGDIQGIIEKLDYLQWLGVDVIWLSPFYKSPMADFGYDVADYTAVDPLFGTMQDFNRLIDAAHQKGIKVLIDFVVNHTSDHHPWFRQSKRSKTNSKRNWYVWRDAKPDGSPPNDWLSLFGGSAWEWDAATRQYYLHSYLRQQPDLNWHNPEVRQAMFDAVKFWLNKGVDGFRLDAVYWIAKDERYRDDPPNPTYDAVHDDPYNSLRHTHSRRERHLFPYLSELAKVIRGYPGKFVVAEAYPEHKHDIAAYEEFYDNIDPSLLSPFNFEAIAMPWEAEVYKDYIDAFQAALDARDMPVYVLGNHDTSRVASRVGRRAARTAAMLQLTLPGMPFIYYGEELGLSDTHIPKTKVQDPFEKNVPGFGLGRDPERTPMPWTAEKHAGFSAQEPWLPLNKDYKKVNVAWQQTKGDSFLSLYRRLLHLRRSMDVLKFGDYQPLEMANKQLYGYRRTHDGESVTILLNFSSKHQKIEQRGKLLVSTHSLWLLEDTELRPHEGRVIAEA